MSLANQVNASSNSNGKRYFKIKQNIGIGIVGWLVMFAASPSHALTVEEVPNPRKTDYGWVTDMTDILSDRTENQLNQMISQLESDNGTEIAVVTVPPDTSPSSSPKEFTTELFNYWGIGKVNRDNGVLFLISLSDHRTEIETGYGMTGILPDEKVDNIINTQIIPQFKQKHFDEGTLAGTKELITVIKASKNETAIAIMTGIETFITKFSAPIFFTGIICVWFYLVIALSSRKIFVRPDKVKVRKHLEYYNGYRFAVFCELCKQKMERLQPTQLENELSMSEKIDREIDGIQFEGWRCLHCSSEPVLISFKNRARNNSSSSRSSSSGSDGSW